MTIQEAASAASKLDLYSNYDEGKEQLRRRHFYYYYKNSSTSTSSFSLKSKIPVYCHSNHILMANRNLDADEAATNLRHQPTLERAKTKLANCRSKSICTTNANLTQTIDVSSDESFSAYTLDNSNLASVIKWLRKCLRRIERSYSIDALYEFLQQQQQQVKNLKYSNLTLNSLESSGFNSMSINKSFNRSSSMMRSIPVEKSTPPIEYVYESNLNLAADASSQSSQSPMKLLFEHLRMFRKLYSIMQTDLLASLLTVELKTLPTELKTYRLPSIGDTKEDMDSIHRYLRNYK